MSPLQENFSGSDFVICCPRMGGWDKDNTRLLRRENAQKIMRRHERSECRSIGEAQSAEPHLLAANWKEVRTVLYTVNKDN